MSFFLLTHTHKLIVKWLIIKISVKFSNRPILNKGRLRVVVHDAIHYIHSLQIFYTYLSKKKMDACHEVCTHFRFLYHALISESPGWGHALVFLETNNNACFIHENKKVIYKRYGACLEGKLYVCTSDQIVVHNLDFSSSDRDLFAAISWYGGSLLAMICMKLYESKRLAGLRKIISANFR